MDQTVTLKKEQWEQILNVLADVPWRISNPLLMAIGSQLRLQHEAPINQTAPPGGAVRLDGVTKNPGEQPLKTEH